MMTHYLTRIRWLFHRIGQRPLLKKTGQNTTWLLIEKGSTGLVSFFVGVAVARHLTPSGYGTLASLNNLLGLLITFTSLGLDPIIQQQLIRYPRRHAAIMHAALAARLGSSLLIGFLLVLYQWMSPTPWGWEMMALMGCGLLGNTLSMVRAYYESHLLIQPIVLIQLMVLLLSSLMKMVGIWYHWPVAWFFFTQVAEGVLFGMIGLVFISFKQLTWALPSPTLIRHLLRHAWPFLLFYVVLMGQNRLDQWLLYYWTTPHQTGLYALAVRFCEYAFVLPGMIVSVAQPVLQPLKHQNPTLFRDRLAQLSGLMTLVSLGVIGFLWVASYFLFTDLYGTDYAPSIGMTWVYALCFLGWGQVPICHIFMLSHRYTFYWIAIGVLGLIPYGLLLAIFIPQWGGLGAALASVMTIFVSTLCLPALFAATRPLCGIYWQGMTLRSLRGISQRWWASPPG